ncbi:response regulator transcription factor [Synechococcus sp. PCC 6312]|uniref:response regulator transcription factor n=1 Tax=Synechococcus sp. (strain ATCC 27167 / PCC 6312) TaxID=195253 RepID=UPI00029EDF30|nr:response regulator transcription factor [Synechococcus sp. PCC 6312]AFY62596.1 response regulator containing a CheY-like receiver domain and an HTH DNA-binding domain [Synechococcus sp. PCC 6312]
MPLTVLVTDDDPGIRMAVHHYLEDHGYLVLQARHGQEALAMINQFQPHLLITDIAMPEMDGYQLVQRIRQQPALRLLPVIYLTGRSQTQARIKAYQTGADSYLSKPFELEELGAIVRNLLERNQLIQAEWQQRTISQTPPALGAPTHESLTPAPALTPREEEVLRYLSQGLSNAQIGGELHLSARTIEKYVGSLLQKFQAHNRAELVRIWVEHNQVS